MAPDKTANMDRQGSAPVNLFNRLSQVLQKESYVDEEGGNKKEAKKRQFLATQAQWASDLVLKLISGDAAGQLDKLNPSVINSCQVCGGC